MAQRIAVVGGGWAGLAAAVEATRLGQHVTLIEMAPHLGGRARQVDAEGLALDNGQHILIGAYTQTLALMRRVGVDADAALLRMPLRVAYPDGSGLQLAAGAAIPAFAKAVLGYQGWSWRDKLALLSAATGWGLRGFRCEASLTVEGLIGHLPQKVRDDLLDPLCVAALNTPGSQASARVFLRVLKDALFAGPGSADLLLPRQRLSALWPEPAARWLASHGATVRLAQRVGQLDPQGAGWGVDGERFDGVVLACSAHEAARLAAPHALAWSALAQGFRYEPIVTVYARSPGTRLPLPMLALHADTQSPAQFVFDLGQLGGPEGLLAFVVSGASGWTAQGAEAVTAAVLAQAQRALKAQLVSPLEAIRTLTEKRATFLCTPGLARPVTYVAPGLAAAGDYIAGPYPATLEGAMCSGIEAITALAGR